MHLAFRTIRLAHSSLWRFSRELLGKRQGRSSVSEMFSGSSAARCSLLQGFLGREQGFAHVTATVQYTHGKWYFWEVLSLLRVVDELYHT